jgi:hypothetical protein
MEDSGRSDDTPHLIIHDKIIVQPPPAACESPPPTPFIPPKSPNRRSRWVIARFKAVLKGNFRWPTSQSEAMESEDAQQWEAAMKKELDSIAKKETWTLVLSWSFESACRHTPTQEVYYFNFVFNFLV